MKAHSLLRLGIIFTLFATVFIQSCTDDDQSIGSSDLDGNQLVTNAKADVIKDWYKLYLDIEKDLEDFRPNPTSRALGYIGVAAYEAAVPGMPDYLSASSFLSGYHLAGTNPYNHLYWNGIVENEYFWEAVLNRTYFQTFNYFLFGMNADQIDQVQVLYDQYDAEIQSNLSPEFYAIAIERAEEITNAVIGYAESDTEGASQIFEIEPEDYQAPVGTGLWKPTPPDFSNACHPYWREVRLLVTPQDGVIPEPHIPYSEDVNSEFYQQAAEVNNAINNLTHEDRWIAEFWSDDLVGITFSPPARQVAIANQLIELEHSDMETSLHLYLRLGLALNDASVICWGAKYVYNLERPIDYIRRVINPDFQPILGDALGVTGQNPNFPAYPSGHSSFAGAGAAVFNLIYPNVSSFTDRCHENRTSFLSEPRTYSSFDEMAEENAYSRIPLGVHFRMDCDEGLRIGQEVGEYITRLSITK